MERVLDKIIVFAGCCLALMLVTPSTLEVTGLLAAVTAAALFEVVPGRARRAGTAAYLVLATACAPCALFAPLAAYDCIRSEQDGEGEGAGGSGSAGRTAAGAAGGNAARGAGAGGSGARTPSGGVRADAEAPWETRALRVLCAAALAAALPRLPLSAAGVMLAMAVVAALLSWRTSRLLADKKRQRIARDSMREHSLALELRNRDLRDKQDYEVHVATLTERGRIAREIHDNVGHLLTRAILQVEAMQVVHAQDAQVTRELAPVSATLSEALASVRASVHALHDDALDLEGQVRECARGCEAAGIAVTIDYAVDDAPAPVALCLIAIAREALANVMRHSGATKAHVRLTEYPALYQITVTDNGGGNAGAGARAAGPARGSGMGLQSMEERVTALGGSFRAGFERTASARAAGAGARAAGASARAAGAGAARGAGDGAAGACGHEGQRAGFRVFASIPKEAPDRP
ncbi:MULTISPECIES: sensor histidine kinase [unclassified Adlercreutzia]|uniref:sensor histidine kinase n=1 Tax=unclassified Adlercreutzia TaxID=2636013 RepID=UPI0013EB064D|nr:MULTISPECIES: histidine kinase [unclassified Adlercreutzia]